MCYWFIYSDMRYPELPEKHSNVDKNIMHKLPKEGALHELTLH